MEQGEILRWLKETDPEQLGILWQRADETRRRHVGNDVWLRGLIEVSNVCAQHCAYCGIAACAPPMLPYRLTLEEILACAHRAEAYGFGTVVLQAGEDPGITLPWMASVIQAIKAQTGLAITLSLGEQTPATFSAWKSAGAERYLLRFETSDPALYDIIHPSGTGGLSGRFQHLTTLRALGFEIGTGVMVGIPGQTWETLAQDIQTFRQFDMDMIGVGPYVESPGTPLAGELGAELRRKAGPNQVPNSALMTCKVVALTRLVCPWTNIPSTTALATVNPSEGRAQGLQRGANVVMPNLTPPQYRVLYQIYPGKAGLHETADITREKIERQIEALGRTIGKGPGTSPRVLQRRGLAPGNDEQPDSGTC